MMIYKDKSKTVAERVEHLLSLMTTEEKAGQLVQPFGWQTYTQDQGNITLNETFKRQVEKGGVGSLYGTLRADPWTGVTLENGLSAKAGAEGVQLYIADIVSQMTRPAKELKAFSKIRLEPGETRTIAFQIGAEQLQYIGRDLKPVVEPGQFHLHVGRNVNDTQWIELTVEEA